jgi:hypothetical protein
VCSSDLAVVSALGVVGTRAVLSNWSLSEHIDTNNGISITAIFRMFKAANTKA